MPFNPLGLQPVIRDGVRGEGLVTRSAAGPDSSGMGQEKGYTGGFRHFSATTPMIVQVPGSAPFYVTPQRLASREKYAVIGMRLPLTVSRDSRRIRIEWDEAPTIDEMIERGERMFTDPDAIAAELEAAWIEVAAHAGGYPPRRMARAAIDGPNARVMAVGHGANDHETLIGKWELLLSVSMPGQPRYGYRFKKRVPRKTIVIPGADIPVQVDAHDVQIDWDRIGSAWNFSAGRAPVTALAPPAAPDPLDQLKRLGDLRDAGILTQAEFADEKARVLRQI
jgi:putative oligomerization/nucleic acid binding protein